MSHISANNIDRKLIIVSLSLSAGSRNRNMAQTMHWSVGAVVAIFKMADTNCQCPISRQIMETET